MKIAHVITSVAVERGGPSHSVPALAAAQRALGHDARLVTLDDTPDWRAAIEGVDLVHQHGIWELSLARLDRELLRRSIPYYVSLRGTLDRWSREQKLFKKRLAWRLYQRRLLEGARAIFALTDEEVAEAREWLRHDRYCVAPNGAEVPANLPDPDVLTTRFPAILNGASPHKTVEGSEPCRRPPVLLFMARLHHKKGLDLLPRILKRVRERHGDARLIVAGEAREDQRRYVDEMRAGFREAGVAEGVVETGLLRDEMKWAAFAAADVFVLPSHEEGMPMAALEALAAGVPCALSTACRLGIVSQRGAGRVEPLDPDRIADAASDLLQDLDGPRAAARRLAAEEFTWKIAAERTLEAYGVD